MRRQVPSPCPCPAEVAVEGPLFTPGHFDPFVGGAKPGEIDDFASLAKVVNTMMSQMDKILGMHSQVATLSKQVASMGKSSHRQSLSLNLRLPPTSVMKTESTTNFSPVMSGSQLAVGLRRPRL